MSIVIVGNGPAAISAIESIRMVGYSKPIILVTKESIRAYTPCFLADYVKGSATKHQLFLRDEDFYNRKGVKVIYGNAVEAVDTEYRQVFLEDGSRLRYERLLLACGANPVIPNIEGISQEGVYTFKSINDAEKIKEDLKEGTKTIIIGGGFIGLEIAEALKTKGLDITIIEKEHQLLPKTFDYEGAFLIKEHLQKHGIDVQTSTEVVSIERDIRGMLTGIYTKIGEFIPCNAIVLTLGVKPNIEVVKDSPIETKKGVVVDASMRTSVSGVFAAGDLAQVHTDNGSMYLPTHPVAIITGRLAGENIVGGKGKMGNLPINTNVLKLFGMYVCSIGDTSLKRYERIKHKGMFKKLFFHSNGVIKGAQIIGSAEKAGIFLSAIQKKTKIDKELIFTSNLTILNIKKGVDKGGYNF